MKTYGCYLSLGCFGIFVATLFSIGCTSESDKLLKTAESLYRKSVEYREAGEHVKAIEKLDEALNKYQIVIVNFPNRSDFIASSLYQIWNENYEIQFYEGASLVLKKLVRNFPVSSAAENAKIALSVSAFKNENQQNWKEVRRAYKEIIEAYPKDLVPKGDSIKIKQARDLYLLYRNISLYSLGKTESRLGNYDDARTAWRVLISEFPKSDGKGEVRHLIAQSYLDQSPKDYYQAYLNFDKLTTAQFKDDTKLQAEAMYKTAYCLKALKVNDEALGRYAEFMTRFPDSKYITDAYLDLGVFYANHKNDYELARFYYKRALESTNDSNRKAEIWYKIGDAYFDEHNFEKADEHNFEKAIAAYNVILQEYPESKDSHNAKTMIAHIHRRENRTDEAISVYKDIIENHAESKTVNRIITIAKGIDAGFPVQSNLVVLSYAEIGEAYFGKDNFEKAFESYARIVVEPTAEEKDMRKDTYAPFALSRAMVILCKLGRKDELETFATTYIEAFGNINVLGRDELILSAEAQRKFADVLREELSKEPEDYNKAATEYAKLQDYPPKPYLRLNLIKLRGKYYEGLCYENGTKSNKSVEAYQEAIKLFDAFFQPIIDTPNIQHNITEKEFDYCIQTAKEYAKKIRLKLNVPRQNLGDETGKAKDSSDQDITSIALASTVFLSMNNSMGSGFFVGPDLIATNYHVVKGAVEGTARIVKTGMTYAIVGYTAVDPDRDLAILKVRAFDVKPLLLGDNNDISNNTPIYVVGSPKGIEGTLSDGIISNIRPIRNYFTNDGKIVKYRSPYIHMTASISPGNSGGPVLNRKGRVIGVSVATFRDVVIHEGEFKDATDRFPVVDEKDKEIPGYYVDVPKRDAQNINYAIPVNDLKALLKRAGPLKPLSDLEVIN